MARRTMALALLLASGASGACRKAERTDPASASASASAPAPAAATAPAAASAPAAAAAAASASASASAAWALPPRPTEPVLLGNEASFLTGTRALDAIEDVRQRNGGALELLDLHLYPARIVLKAKDPKSDAIQRWEIRTTGVIGPKVEGLSAKKLDGRLFDAALVPLATLASTTADAVTKSGIANGSATLVDVRRGKSGGVTMRIAVHASGATKWVDVDVPKK